MERRQFIQATAPFAAASVAVAETQAAPGAPRSDGPASLVENLPESVQRCRDAALAILKPSAKELEHGLRLHAESLVFDSYGFSPTSSIDGEAIKAQALG